MKKISTLLFLLFAFAMNAQLHLKWETSTEKFSFLKDESVLRLEFNLDSFTVDEILDKVSFKNPQRLYDTAVSSNVSYYSKNPQQLKDSLKTIFENNFNLESGKKLLVKNDLQGQAYNYILKITPLKFYLHEPWYDPDHLDRLPFSRGCYSFYMKGDYLMELYSSTSSIPIITFKLKNLTNKFPMCSDCTPYSKYSNDENIEINRNMIRAGTETARYIKKTIKKSLHSIVK